MFVAVAVLAGVIVVLLAAHERERATWRRERSELLNRIKPETAQALDSQPPVSALDEQPYLPPDAAYWKARGIEVEQ